ncbi:hypothetical protein CDL12_14441 [Handroanthus impetiginosus]|uniref:Uncharacterized protein n=1 Tax=Handroanthus impetiginosus TaxID=429701 RepID=A0A2G9H6K6_9LAMI|nr:hypothetical protein CDL12_14441 [Handroanthus impetiginosus]
MLPDSIDKSLVHFLCSSETLLSNFLVYGLCSIISSFWSLQNDADYYLSSDAYVSITEMWKTEAGVEWDGINILDEDLEMAAMGMPRPQTPPSGVGDLPPVVNYPPR